MGSIQFGGRLGAVFDSEAHVSVTPRCTGNVDVPFEAPAEFKAAAQSALVRHAGEQLVLAMRSKAFLSIDQPALGEMVAHVASIELGVTMTSRMFGLGLSEEDADALSKAAAAAAAAIAARAQILKQPATSSTLSSSLGCPRCGVQGGGRFCASCGSPMAAPAAPAAEPMNLAPPPAQDWLTSPINVPIGIGSRIAVPDGFAFVGFINYVMTQNLRGGQHVLQQACDKGCFVRLTGLPFAIESYIQGRGKQIFRGTIYVQDPVAQFRAMQTIDATLFDVLGVILGRCADLALPSASSDADLCQKIGLWWNDQPDAIAGVVIVLSSVAPKP